MDTSPGSLTRLSVVSAGSSYRIGDVVSLDNSGTGGRNASAIVDEIVGSSILSVASTTVTFQNVEFSQTSNNLFVGICTIPHSITNNEIITVNNLNSYQIDLTKSPYVAGITTHSINLSTNLDDQSVTGIVTFINVYGNLNYPNIRVGDIYTIDNEKIEILEINREFSQLKILRGYGGTSGVAHTQGSVVFENPRKFTISVDFNQKKDLGKSNP